MTVEIANSGPGLTEVIKQRLFEPLFTTKPMGKVTGLDLSISRQIIVERHQGRIECVSEPGKGCKFVLELLVASMASMAEEAEEAEWAEDLAMSAAVALV